jgi:hypothetical protein
MASISFFSHDPIASAHFYFAFASMMRRASSRARNEFLYFLDLFIDGPENPLNSANHGSNISVPSK